MMTEFERIDFLVKLLEGDNAKAFSLKSGIPESSLCRVRKGNGKPASYYERILAAYPEVRKQWLYSGDGEAFREKKEKGDIVRKIESLEREVRNLSRLIEELMSYQKSTNPR